MAESAAVTAAVAEMNTSSYRVKLSKSSFLELVDAAKPQRVYKRKKNHFFAFDGFMMYSQECDDSDFQVSVIDTMELSNYQWAV